MNIYKVEILEEEIITVYVVTDDPKKIYDLYKMRVLSVKRLGMVLILND